MEREPLFRPVNEPGLWECELCQVVEVESANWIRCCVVPTRESASGLGFETIHQKLKDRLREDMKQRAKFRKTERKEPGASRRPHLQSMGYVHVGPVSGNGTRTVLADFASEHWRRTLDRL